MINCRVNNGEVSASIQGNVITLGAEVCVLIKSMYNSIRENDEKSAKKFREIITDEVNGGVIFNGINGINGKKLDDDDDDDGDDEAEEADDAGDADNEMDDMIKSLGKLKELAEALKQLKDMVEDED